MKGNISYLLVFAVGAVAGFIAGKLWQEKKEWKKLNQNEDTEIEEKYKRNLKEYLGENEETSVDPERRKEEIQGYLSDANEGESIDYHKMFQSEVVKRRSGRYPCGSEKDPFGKDQNEELSPEEEASLDHLQHRDDSPRIVEEEELGDLPAYVGNHVLYLYIENELICDENDEPIENEELFIGNLKEELLDYCDCEDRMIQFVFNPSLDTVFEIQTIEYPYEADDLEIAGESSSDIES